MDIINGIMDILDVGAMIIMSFVDCIEQISAIVAAFFFFRYMETFNSLYRDGIIIALLIFWIMKLMKRTIAFPKEYITR